MSRVRFPPGFERDHPNLARVFRQHWDTPLEEYAKRLFRKKGFPIEPELISSFEEEWREVGLAENRIAAASRQLSESSVIQTSHHIAPTCGPTFSTVDLISLSGLSVSDCYLIGASSGVAFSNPAWSGSLCYGELSISHLLEKSSRVYHRTQRAERERRNHGRQELRLSLIPSGQRDRLVYGTKLTTFQSDLYASFSPKLKSILHEFGKEESYSRWAAKTCARIQNHAFDTDRIVIFDINQAIKRYLLKILANGKEHPVKRILFDKNVSDKIRRAFPFSTPFLGHYRGKKSDKVDRLFWEENRLVGKKETYPIDSAKKLHRLIEQEQLCPGLFIVFFVLRFLNGIRCLGSFNQIEYLEEFRRTWQSLDLEWNMDLEPDNMHMLTTGRIKIDGKPIWPLDLFFRGERIQVRNFQTTRLGDFWQPIVEELSK